MEYFDNPLLIVLALAAALYAFKWLCDLTEVLPELLLTLKHRLRQLASNIHSYRPVTNEEMALLGRKATSRAEFKRQGEISTRLSVQALRGAAREREHFKTQEQRTNELVVQALRQAAKQQQNDPSWPR